MAKGFFFWTSFSQVVRRALSCTLELKSSKYFVIQMWKKSNILRGGDKKPTKEVREIYEMSNGPSLVAALPLEELHERFHELCRSHELGIDKQELIALRLVRCKGYMAESQWRKYISR